MRNLKLLILLAVLLLPFCTAKSVDVIVDSIKYTIINDNEAKVIGYVKGIKNAVIKDSVDGRRVREIQGYCFNGCSSLTSVTIHKGLERIGYQAFEYCQGLISITIPEGVTIIEQKAFSHSGLVSVVIPNSLSYLSDQLFSDCTHLTSVILPDSLVTISQRVFYNCTNLTNISLPKGLMNLRNEAFYNCSSLNTIVVPDKIKNIDSYVFSGCSSLTSVSLPDSLFSIGSGAFSSCQNLSSISIPEKVTSIGNSAFAGCSSLSSIVIPDSVTSIGDYAFYSCSGLISITIPSRVTSIGSFAFNGCSSLSSIEIPDGVTSIGNSAFKGCISLSSIEIPSGITIIDDYTFSECIRLKTITISETVTAINAYAFSGCSNMSSIEIPDGVTSIGSNVFEGCSSLSSIEIPDGVTSIGNNVFEGCSSLSSIEIPDGVTSIGSSAFKGCSSLSSIEIPDGVTSIGNSAFKGCISLSSIEIPSGITIIDDYTFSECIRLKTITISETVTAINAYAFSGCSNMSSIEIPNGVTSIGSHAFGGCTGLKSFSIPNGVSKIEYQTFADCINLTSLSIPWNCSISVRETNNLLYIYFTGDGVANYETYSSLVNTIFFVDDSLYDKYLSSSGWGDINARIFNPNMLHLTEVQIIANPKRSSLFALLGNNSLNIANLKIKGSINGYDIMALRNKTIHLQYLDLSEADIVANDDGYEYYTGYSLKSDNSLGEYSFANTYLREVVLPKSLVSIEKDAFNGCKYLEKVVISDGIKEIGSRAFYNCGNLYAVNIPSSLLSIGESTFQDCKRLSFPLLRIPDNINTISNHSFQGCPLIDTLIIGKNLLTIGTEAFRNSGVSTVVLGTSVKEINGGAFRDCNKLHTIVFNRNLLIIGESAFSGCNNLLEVSMPYSVENIGSNAFANCSSLKALKIPSMTKNIGSHAFWGCDSIENVYTYTVEPTNINQETFSCYRKAMLNVPKASADLYVYDTKWSQFLYVQEFEEPYDAFYLNGDFILDDSIGRLSGEPDAELFTTSGFIVKGEDKQELKDVELVHDGKDGATIIGAAEDESGEQINLTAQSMKVNISVDGNRWYFFCFPFVVEHDSIECTTDYMFCSYDGKQRAKGNITGWQRMESDFTSLQKDVGYIFQTSRNGVLTIHVSSDYLTFTANNEKDQLHTYASDDVSNASWNFIGNPFICYYDVEDLANEYDAPIVVWNGNGYTAYKPGDDDYQLKPFEAFFVQKESGTSYVEFLPENRMTGNQAATRSSLRVRRRAEMGTPITLDRQLVNIVLTGQDSISDRTRIVYSTKASMDYEIGVDAAKFHTDGIPEIYTVNGTTKYAINERPMGTDDIKLGYIAPKAGTYTLSVPRHDAEIEIYDNETHQTVDFTFGDYQFTTKAGTYNDRFVIHKTSGGVTAVDNGFRLDGMTVTAFDGGIDIEGQFKGKVQIYSESGMLMAEPKQAGRVQLDGGVYIIKIGDRSIKLSKM